MASFDKENLNKLNYRIKLLAGNNVVLVEANNYESEIFVPQIVNGRITFQNIIPNRRCCQGLLAAKQMQNGAPVQNNETPQTLMQRNDEGNNGVRRREFRMSAGQDRVMPKPLANSTPAGIKQRPRSCGAVNTNSVRESLGNTNSQLGGNDSSLPTPEPIRRAVPASQQLINNNILMKMPPGIKIMPLYHNSMERTPKKLGRLVATSANASQNLANLSLLNGSFRLPSTPPMAKCFRRTTTSSSTPISNRLQSSAGNSSAQWHKVITPVRTYTRRCQQPIIVNRPTRMSSAKKSYKTNKVIPTFLINPTQAPKVTHKVDIRRRRLIIDGKISISPRTFKKQQLEPLTPAPSWSHRKSLAQPTAFQLSSLPKSRHQLKSAPMSAFDMLTNSNRCACINDKLNKQFRNGCINKASSTISAYKKLTASIPPLQQDEQILELSHISWPKNTSGERHPKSCQIINTNACSDRISLPLSNNNTMASSINLRTS